jgi:hypothetical protein
MILKRREEEFEIDSKQHVCKLRSLDFSLVQNMEKGHATEE